MRAAVTVLLAGALLLGACRTTAEGPPELTESGRIGIEETLRDFGEREDFGGAVALVQLGGRVVLDVAAPARGEEAPASYDARTIFPIYSMTKPIVSVAVLQLVEEGRLSLSVPIDRYLPEFAKPEVVVLDQEGRITGTRPAEREITVGDLLAHTSGLCYGLYEEGAMKALYEEASLERPFASNRELSRAIAALPLAFDPGSEWRYGRSTDVLGALLEEIEGESLQAVLERRVFEPLGMEDTGFYVRFEAVSRVHRVHREVSLGSSEPVPMRFPGPVPLQEPAACNAGGGLYSTAADYLRFCQMLLGRGQREGVRLLSEEFMLRLTADRIAGLPRPRFMRDRGFGLGVACLTEESADPLNGSVGSFHWSGFYGTSFFVDPANDLTAVFLVHQRRDFSYMVAFREAVYSALSRFERGPVASGKEVGE